MQLITSGCPTIKTATGLLLISRQLNLVLLVALRKHTCAYVLTYALTLTWITWHHEAAFWGLGPESFYNQKDNYLVFHSLKGHVCTLLRARVQVKSSTASFTRSNNLRLTRPTQDRNRPPSVISVLKRYLFFNFLEQQSRKPQLVYHQKNKTHVCKLYHNNTDCFGQMNLLVFDSPTVFLLELFHIIASHCINTRRRAATLTEELWMVGQNCDIMKLWCYIFGPTVADSIAYVKTATATLLARWEHGK